MEVCEWIARRMHAYAQALALLQARFYLFELGRQLFPWHEKSGTTFTTSAAPFFLTLCALGNSTTSALHRTQPFVRPYYPPIALFYILILTSSTPHIFDMSGMLPAHVYGLRVPAGVGPIPAAIDFPASVSSFLLPFAIFASSFCRRMELCCSFFQVAFTFRSACELTATVPHHNGCPRPQRSAPP
jgi:hypothetical protein